MSRDRNDDRHREHFDEVFLAGAARAVSALAEAVPPLETAVPPCVFDGTVTNRGHFRPSEDEELMFWFARFLTIRGSLWEVLTEASGPIEGEITRVMTTFDWRCFVLAYSAACLIARLDHFLIERVATDSIVQRKLNEGARRYRIDRKQFTRIFESVTDPHNALLIDEARRFAHRNWQLINAMANDELVGEHAAALRQRERSLDPNRRRYIVRLLRFLSHTFRRRGASARQKALQSVLEASGRLLSEIRDLWTPPRIDSTRRAALEALLRPGDVLITRHDLAVTNLFLPGFWPHAALFVGTASERDRMGVLIDPERRRRWNGDRTVLEALKDGVLFRSLETTLAVDAVVVIRPQLRTGDIAEALSRVSVHEGKGYNFDFDFFRTDRLVCTEVVYRAFDGIGPIDIPLRERSGRPTLSAEDLLDLAIAGRGFDPVAISGVEGCLDTVVSGAEVHSITAASYRSGN